VSTCARDGNVSITISCATFESIKRDYMHITCRIVIMIIGELGAEPQYKKQPNICLYQKWRRKRVVWWCKRAPQSCHHADIHGLSTVLHTMLPQKILLTSMRYLDYLVLLDLSNSSVVKIQFLRTKNVGTLKRRDKRQVRVMTPMC
jgi:hypothetical protein